MDNLEGWVRDALSPRYEVIRELARGGMAIVYLARDQRLEREVAIKVLPPAHATATSTENFLREAKILASISHPSLVPVHDADTSQGIFYFVMDYVPSPTVAEVLTTGPPEQPLALKLGCDLLDALTVVHAAGIIHRDIKPANIFVHEGRGLLADFGIAHTDATLTGNAPADLRVGTPAYMSPEQFEGRALDERGDLYSAAMVIYELFTGRRWPRGALPADEGWHDMPATVARVLKRALEPDPEARWPTATLFRQKLWRTHSRPRQRQTALLVVAGVVTGAAALSVMPRPQVAPPPEGIVVQVHATATLGDPPPSLADSIAPLFARLLSGTADFRVCDPDEHCDQAQVEVRSTLAVVDGRPTLRVEHHSRDAVELVHEAAFDPAGWSVAVDEATNASIRAIWSSTSPLARWLPVDALPTTDAGYEAWLGGEALLRHASWGAAREAFERAVAIDSSCLLCSWRITEVQRWLLESPDPVHLLRVDEHPEAFPPWYRPLIEWRFLPLEERIAMLRDATAQWPGFPPLWFALGEELNHRGPLAGHHRSEAVLPFRRAVRLDPGSGPAWQELAWLTIAEGDRVAATEAVSAYDSLLTLAKSGDPYDRAQQALLHAGFAWRFMPDGALGALQPALADPQLLSYPELGAGARLLPEFGLRHGMLELGEALARLDPPSEMAFTARVAVLLGLTATGRIRRARDYAADLELAFSGFADIAGFRAKFEAALNLLDPEAVAGVDGAMPLPATDDFLRQSLAPRPTETLAPDVVRLLAAGDLEPAAAVASVEGINELAEFFERQEAALTVRRLPDPFFRTILRFMRADWKAAAGDPAGAATDLLFAESVDVTGFPAGLPQAADIDWAFSTLAHWRRAMLLIALQRQGDSCRDLQVVRERWNEGDPVYRDRARQAADLMTSFGCPVLEGLGW